MSIYQSAVKKPITTALIYVAIAIFRYFFNCTDSD